MSNAGTVLVTAGAPGAESVASAPSFGTVPERPLPQPTICSIAL
jgi:hypothetical protein